jgi:CRP-like cAMP-binding protein
MNFDFTELVETLRKHPFFKGLNDAQYGVLADCAMRTTFKPGEVIFNEGDVANRFYLIESGEVQLEAELMPHEYLGVQQLGGGDVLGWSWLFPPYYWHFSARARSPVTAVFFYGTRLRERCDQDPALGYELMRRVSEIVIRRLQMTRRELLVLKQSAEAKQTSQKTA